MIDAGPSLEAAKGLAGTELLNYLLGKGWTAEPSKIDGISVVSKEVAGADGPAMFPLPVAPGWEDEQRRVADALRTISAIEGRSMTSIVSEIRSASRKAARESFDRGSPVVGELRDEPDETGRK